MTLDTNAARATLLAVLMVASVAVTGVSASAGGTTTASVSSAIEYGGTIELALAEGDTASISSSDVTVWVDGAERSVDVDRPGTDGRIVLTGLDDVGPHESLVVNVDSSDLSTGNLSVQVTGAVLEAGPEQNIFKGASVAYVASDTGVSFEIFRGGEFLRSRNTGTNSKVFVIDTDDGEIGPSYFVNETSGAEVTTKYNLRDLGLEASVNTTEVPGGGGVQVTATSASSSRPIVVRLVDAGDGSVVRSTEGRIGGDGEGTVTLNGLSEGSYTIEVEDTVTGITATTAEITVGAVEEGSVEFVTNVVSEQRGDVVDVGLSFQGSASGGTADVTLGGDDLNFEVAFTVEDTDGDGQATVHWNVAESGASDAGISVSGGELQGDVDVVTGVDDPVVTGEYPLSVAYRGTETDVGTVVVEERSIEGINVWSAPASVSGFDDAADLRSTVTASDTVALDTVEGSDDWAVLELSATGLEGYLESVDDLDGSEGISLSIVQTEDTVGPNQDPLRVDVSRATLFTDGDNDTYFVAFRADEVLLEAEPGDEFVANLTVTAGNPATSSSQTVTSTVRFVNGTASFDASGGTVQVPASGSATVTGTSTFAPGTRLSIVLRSEGGENPFVETVDGIVVQEDGSWSATADLSEAEPGQTFTARVKKDGTTRQSLEGEMLEPGASTPTESDETTETTEADGTTETTEADATTEAGDEETTEAPGTAEPSPTTAPGFGVVVTLVAVLAVVLLARRD